MHTKTLTPTQLAVLPLLASGLTNSQVGRRIGKTGSSVGHALEAMMLATNTRSRGELIAYGYVHGLLDTTAWPPRGVAA